MPAPEGWEVALVMVINDMLIELLTRSRYSLSIQPGPPLTVGAATHFMERNNEG